MNIGQFVSESWNEVKNEVTWPKWSELQSSATLVLVASLIFALVVGALDFVISRGLDFLYTSLQ